MQTRHLHVYFTLTDRSRAADARGVHLRALAAVDRFVRRVLHVSYEQLAGRSQAVCIWGLRSSASGTENEKAPKNGFRERPEAERAGSTGGGATGQTEATHAVPWGIRVARLISNVHVVLSVRDLLFIAIFVGLNKLLCSLYLLIHSHSS